MQSDTAPVTRMLAQLRQGDTAVVEKLLPLVYDELRRIAADYMNRERPSHTLQATGLVNEAYLRLVQGEAVHYESRSHFLAIAATAMRRILVDHARKKGAEKHGGKQQKVLLEDAAILSEQPSEELLALDEALTRLAQLDERQCRIIELRYFAGLTIEETAQALGVAPVTVKREWRMARAWLYNEIKEN